MPVYKSVEIGHGMVKLGEILYPAGTDASLHQVVLGSQVSSVLFHSAQGDVICLKHEHRKMAILVYCPEFQDLLEFEQHYSATDEMKKELVIVDMAKITSVVYNVTGGSFILHPMPALSLPILRGGRFNTLHTKFGNTVRFVDINACALVTWEVSSLRQKYVSYFAPEKILHQLAVQSEVKTRGEGVSLSISANLYMRLSSLSLVVLASKFFMVTVFSLESLSAGLFGLSFTDFQSLIS